MSEATIEHKKLSDLTPDDKNANKGTERGHYMVSRSLEKFGAGRSVLLDKNGRVIAGNKTVESAQSIGMEDIVIVHVRGDQLVGVMRDDLDLDDAAARGLAYADNRASEVDLVWDSAQIAEDLTAGIDLSDFWFDGELDELVAKAASVTFKEFDESIEKTVEYHTCPSCGHTWPK